MPSRQASQRNIRKASVSRIRRKEPRQIGRIRPLRKDQQLRR